MERIMTKRNSVKTLEKQGVQTIADISWSSDRVKRTWGQSFQERGCPLRVLGPWHQGYCPEPSPCSEQLRTDRGSEPEDGKSPHSWAIASRRI